MSLRVLILSSFLVSYWINPVSALMCYECSSDLKGDCYINASKAETVECSLNLGRNGNISMISNNLAINLTRYSSINDQFSFNCGKFKGTTETGISTVIRSCAPVFQTEDLTCSMIKAMAYQKLKLNIHSCHFCSKDYCNFSNTLTVSLFTMIISLIISGKF